MAFEQVAKCRSCGKPVDFIVRADTGRSMAFDDAKRPVPPGTVTRWVQFPDRRTGTPRARRLADGEHLEPDDELVRPHYATCAGITRNNHDR